MTHLGRWLSALVDGELDEAERDHVLNHLAGCAACRREANALRALKRRMTALGDTSADSAVVGRLIDLGRSDPRSYGGPLFAASGSPARSAGYPQVGRARPPWRGWKLATGSAGAMAAAIGLAAFVLGAPPGSPRPRVTPAVDAYWMEHVHDMGQAPPRPGAPGFTGPIGGKPAVAASATPSAANSSAPPPSAAKPTSATPSAIHRHSAKRPAAPAHTSGQPVPHAFAP